MDLTTWLMDSDPAIRWQVLRDLTDAPPAEVAAERARVATTGWGRDLLNLEHAGRWAGGACFPARDWLPPSSVVGDPDAQPWTGTYPTLRLLQEMGIEPSHPDVRAALDRVRESCRWEYDDLRFFDGEVEPCINGGTVAVGAYFGQDVDGIVQRLVGERLDDGGWNCEATQDEEGRSGSTRSSFHTTICVLEGLLEYERAGGTIPVAEARRGGEEYLLSRALMKRASTGEIIDPTWLQLSFPTQWYYDVLRALDYFRRVGGAADERLTEAVEQVRGKQQPDGTWLLENTHPGLRWFDLEDGDGRPSRWNTLRALRVLRWYDEAAPAQTVQPAKFGQPRGYGQSVGENSPG